MLQVKTTPQSEEFIALEIEYLKKKAAIKPLIDKIMSWNLSRVRDYLISNEYLKPEDVDARIIEYRRFLCLHLLTRKPMPISEKVDEVWHTHILFTRDYVQMGEEIFGGYFHHNPTVNSGERKELSNEYEVNTATAYEVMFGKPSKKYWPQNAQICFNDPPHGCGSGGIPGGGNIPPKRTTCRATTPDDFGSGDPRAGFSERQSSHDYFLRA